ncbi:MAG TPA: hypothetical protein QF353_06700 [Gammaproteobacteria bacterium]|nr:hypothetical protein [Gammaproteobacteria bacterium]
MKNKVVKSAKEQLNRLRDLKQELATLQTKLQDVVGGVNKITSNGAHNFTRYSQFSYLRAYLTKVDSEFFNNTNNEKIAELVLFAKYIIEGFSYHDAFDALYHESYLSDIKAISSKDEFRFFSLITGLLSVRKMESEINSIDKEMLSLRNFYASFQTGRVSAYKGLKDGDIVTFKNPETQQTEQYQTINIKANKNDASQSQELSLLGHIYIPVNKSDYPIVYICWRGSVNKESWYSDTQLAAGVESYLTHENEILAQISQVIETVVENQGHKKVDLFIAGHSLGGGLAQTSYNSIQRAILRDSEIDKIFKKAVLNDFKGHIEEKYLAVLLNRNNKIKINARLVSSMHLGIWNSPGVIRSVAESSNRCSKALTDRHHIDQNAHFALVSGDLVQTCGYDTILAEHDVNQASLELLYLDNGQLSCNTKIAGVVGGTVAGAVAGSIASGLGIIPGASSGGAGMTALMFYAQKISHTCRLFDDQGRLTKDAKVLKDYSLATSSKNIKNFRKLRNKSFIIRCLSGFSSKMDMLGKRSEMEEIAQNSASITISSFLKSASLKTQTKKVAQNYEQSTSLKAQTKKVAQNSEQLDKKWVIA